LVKLFGMNILCVQGEGAQSMRSWLAQDLMDLEAMGKGERIRVEATGESPAAAWDDEVIAKCVKPDSTA
jgi:hypothetical protein